jgi:hypothetical protein
VAFCDAGLSQPHCPIHNASPFGDECINHLSLFATQLSETLRDKGIKLFAVTALTSKNAR